MDALRYPSTSTVSKKELKEVLAVVKAVNFVRGRDVNNRIFRELCSNRLGVSSSSLPHSGAVRSIGRTLNCFLADVFWDLSNLKLSLQGDNRCFIDLYEKLCLFHENIIRWKKRVGNESLVMFHELKNILRVKNVNCTFKDGIFSHLTAMNTAVEKSFHVDLDPIHYAWIRQQFMVPSCRIGDADPAKECVLELRNYSTQRVQFQEIILINFWIAMLPEYPTYRCDGGLPSLFVAKTEQRNRLCGEWSSMWSVKHIAKDWRPRGQGAVTTCPLILYDNADLVY